MTFSFSNLVAEEKRHQLFQAGKIKELEETFSSKTLKFCLFFIAVTITFICDLFLSKHLFNRVSIFTLDFKSLLIFSIGYMIYSYSELIVDFARTKERTLAFMYKYELYKEIDVDKFNKKELKDLFKFESAIDRLIEIGNFPYIFTFFASIVLIFSQQNALSIVLFAFGVGLILFRMLDKYSYKACVEKFSKENKCPISFLYTVVLK